MMKLGCRIDLTNACNLSCSYCYVNKSDVKIITYKECCSFIDKMMFLPNFNNTVTFFGGEPSLCGTMIKHIIETYPDLKYSIISNGYFIFDHYNKFILDNIDSISISLEGCESAYREYRHQSNLYHHIDILSSLPQKYKDKITINISLNDEVVKCIDEFVDVYHRITNNGLHVHIYSIRGDDGIVNLTDFATFLLTLKKLEPSLLRLIIGKNDLSIDSEFLCTYDNKITLGCEGDLITCSNENRRYGDVRSVDTYSEIYKHIAENHVSFWEGCKNCDVPVGLCQISCPAWIKECLNKKDYEKLNTKCDIERLKHFMRMEE